MLNIKDLSVSVGDDGEKEVLFRTVAARSRRRGARRHGTERCR